MKARRSPCRMRRVAGLRVPDGGADQRIPLYDREAAAEQKGLSFPTPIRPFHCRGESLCCSL
ncbi:hypothetical protein NXT3_PB00298 (plasmid) [Sinorhizobium fredii]|uniref:Uncharacterized protein n=1 Tax=Rhizobium fredii TaxID=380 RepID=A0A2L0HBY4_RHIFR|nr:hypothetical protein NXT3_PB00298 [Sinorhizobium fredii]